jgi:hypothetical protein
MFLRKELGHQDVPQEVAWSCDFYVTICAVAGGQNHFCRDPIGSAVLSSACHYQNLSKWTVHVGEGRRSDRGLRLGTRRSVTGQSPLPKMATALLDGEVKRSGRVLRLGARSSVRGQSPLPKIWPLKPQSSRGLHPAPCCSQARWQ